LRSSHPQTSFAALGPLAEQITRNHPIEQHLGPDSPLGRLYELGARSLLIGVGFDRYTPFHLADYVRPELPARSYSCKVRGRRGRSRWVRFRDLDLRDGHFAALGEQVRERVEVVEGKVGAAPSMVVPLREAVDAALEIRLGVRSPVLTGC
jgi:aminoglycoside 3-N-acetyltransferase